MSDIPFWKWRCTTCKEEPKHQAVRASKVSQIGACKCKAPRHFELVPMTKARYDARFKR